MQLELRRLAQLTGERRFRDAGDAAFDANQSAGMSGLLPVYLAPPDRFPLRVLASKFAFGALAGSYYEYLLKQWLQNPGESPASPYGPNLSCSQERFWRLAPIVFLDE